MTPAEPRAGAHTLRQLFDQLSDALLLLDARGRITFANGAALRLLGCEAGMPLAQLRDAIGAAAVDWAQRSLGRGTAAPSPPLAVLADGRQARLAFQPLDDGASATLRLQLAPAPAPAPRPAPRLGGEAMPELLSVFWDSPFPVTLQDGDFRILDVNQAYLEFTGFTRERLRGTDPIELQPEEDRARNRAQRLRYGNPGHDGELPPGLAERRLVDAGGRERWYRVAHSALIDPRGRTVRLSVLQDTTAEHAARERAERSAGELDNWFDLSPIGMVLFDETGLLVRTNPAFEALVGTVPVLLAEASPVLQALLFWENGAPSPQLQPGSSPMATQAWLPQPGGGHRRLRATLRCYRTPGGQRRYMAIVEDRSIEEERDLAQMQIGALMDTAGLGLATFQESSGWVRHRQAPASEAPAAASAALQSISRDIVLPESLPEYERLQQALRRGERADVRYAVRHPELGQRWLQTRVEPARLASGQQTTSVVTLDITEQHQTQQRSEQLLHELTTILESTSAGIAYIRGDVLVRCNRRFETMLGLGRRGAAGRGVNELFGESPQGRRIAAEALQSLSEGAIYETEFQLPVDGGDGLWYALSVRHSGRAGRLDGAASGPIEAIAVLSDITRLKAQQTELQLLARDRELMFSLSDVGIAYLRGDVLQQANDALAQLCGYTTAELSGLPLGRLLQDGDDDGGRRSRAEALRLFGRWTGEQQIRRRDGRLIWVQVSMRLVVDGDPDGGTIASYVNVDDRHRAEQSVALQAARTRAVLDSVLVGIVTVGAGGIEWMNRSARRMFGGELSDFIGEPIGRVATDEPDHPFRRSRYLDELPEGLAETFECQVKALDGREFWVVGNAVVTGGESAGRQLTYALLDIEHRRQAEARIAEAQASLQRIIEAAPMAIVLRDARSLRVLQANEVAGAAVGSTPAALIGRTPEDIYPADVAAARRADMARSLASGELVQAEYREEANGETRLWDARYLPLAGGGGAPDQLLTVATDVTEQRAAQEARFAAALTQREMLVKEVHHRIKNNLQGVAGLLQQIAQRKPEMAGAIAEVVGQVQAIAQVYGLQVGNAGPLLLRSVAEAIAGSVQRTFGCPIALSLEGGDADAWLLPEGESIPIALSFNELLTNAVKHRRAPQEDGVRCRLVFGAQRVTMTIANRARLAEGFDVSRFRGGVSGLGLVRSLLPRRSATLTIEQRGEDVLTTVVLVPPGIRRHER